MNTPLLGHSLLLKKQSESGAPFKKWCQSHRVVPDFAYVTGNPNSHVAAITRKIGLARYPKPKQKAKTTVIIGNLAAFIVLNQ